MHFYGANLNLDVNALEIEAQNDCDFANVFLAELDLKTQGTQSYEEAAFWGLLNVLDNYPDYFHNPPLDLLMDVYKSKPGVVVSSGPSLDKNRGALKKYRDGLVVFACDAALKTLLTEGIVPDFVGMTKKWDETATAFLGTSELKNTPLLAPSSVSPKSLRAYLGPKMTIPIQQGFDDWIFGEGRFEDLGSPPCVKKLCFTALKRMGCDPIFLLDDDSSGNLEEALSPVVKSRLNRVEAVHRVHSFTANSHRLHETAQRVISRWRGILKFYVAESLKAMREIDEMRRDHDLHTQNIGSEKLYHGFFERLEKELSHIRLHEEQFFDKHFLKMIGGSFFRFRTQCAQLKYREQGFLERTQGLIQTYCQTFNLIHLWSSRSLEALEYHNHRWKFW